MKNLFLTLVFVLGTATSFAGGNSTTVLEDERTCVPVTLSCGVKGWSCGESTLEIIENALAADDALCP